VLEIAEAGLEYSEASFVIISAAFEMFCTAQNLGQHIPAPSVASLYPTVAAFQACGGSQSPVLKEALPALSITLSFSKPHLRREAA